MTQGRWRVSALATLPVLAALSAGPDAAFGQNGATTTAPPAATVGAPRLPSEVYAANPVTPEQASLIQAFAELWVPQLLGAGEAAEGGESTVVSARNELIQPLSFPGVSPDFRTQYSRIVSQRLVGALAPERPLIHRLNTMIVASRLELDAAVFDLILQGLEDPSPAVRYWAVKALSGRPAGALNPQQLNQVFTELEQMLTREEALQVLQQVFQILPDLQGVRGLNLVIDTLNRRVRAHVDQPLLPFDAEHNGMRAAFQKILELQAGGQQIDESMRQLARAAAQYLWLIGRQGDGVVAEGTPLGESYKAMAGLSHQVLNQAHQQFNAGGAPIPPIGNQLNWNQFRVAAEAARNMLVNPPFNFNQLDVTPQAE